jgi:ubiquinone/menaquinone biosynthesis C-methylase UbiE
MEFRNARNAVICQRRPAKSQNFPTLLVPRRRFDPNQPELIDRPDLDLDSLRHELAALEEANRRLGGHHLIVHYLRQMLRRVSLKSITVLDLGTGVADIPRALVAWARARNLSISVTAIDGSPRVLEFARAACRDWPEISLEQHNLLALPHRPNTFDAVICSLALHHFERADAVKILGRVHEIARVSYIVNDLRRNWFSILATPILAGVVMRDEIVRQDAVASCRAAFSLAELRSMADEAGLENYKVNRHHLGFRMVLHGTK